MALHVVVTGAGGFVGGFLARSLAERGCNVTAMTRRDSAEAKALPGLRWRKGDVRASGALPERFDVLLHCAAEIPARCADPKALYQDNVDLARASFEQALTAGARIIVFTSSISVYGAITVPVVEEETPPRHPDDYGRAKWDAERLLQACVRDRGLFSGLSIRLPGTVGKGSHDNFLSYALQRILAGEAISGRHKDAMFNNIVHVGDLAHFVSSWIASPRPGYHVSNIASREPMAIGDMFSWLFACAGKPERITYSVEGKAPFQISLARAMALGYHPATVRDSVAAFVRDSLADR
jgi:nucleoside-diphosphate-sugar epimerase